MTYYAIIILNSSGEVIAVQPEGCQFDGGFLLNIVNSEKNNQSPHPGMFDMGGGFWIHTLWSGIQPFIVQPGYLVGVVVDQKEEQNTVKRLIRILANNLLIHLQTDDSQSFTNYCFKTWNLLEQGQISEIKREKNPISLNNKFSINTNSQLNTKIEKKIINEKEQEDDFGDLLELEQEMGSNPADPFAATTNSVQKTKSVDPFSSDPFSSESIPSNSFSSDPFGGSSTLDPFGGSSTSDPFGGSSTSDPFGGSSTSDPFSSNSFPSRQIATNSIQTDSMSTDPFSDNPFEDSTKKDISTNDFEQVDPFAENPWGNQNQEGFGQSGLEDENLFSANPWNSDEEKNKEIKKKEKQIDPFDENPFA